MAEPLSGLAKLWEQNLLHDAQFEGAAGVEKLFCPKTAWLIQAQIASSPHGDLNMVVALVVET